MCFVFTNPDLIIDEPELQSANLNMDKKGDTLSENEASPTRQRYEPRDIKDLTGHTFGTMPPYFKPVLTIPWTERPDQGISNFPADLTIIERFTTVTQSEQSITTSIPRRLTPGTEIEIVTIIDGTKFILPSSTSDATTTSQESEITSPKETTTDVPSLSTEKTLLTSSPNKSGEESSWTTSYTTASSTELRPSSSPANPSGAPIRSDTAAIVAGAVCGGFIITTLVMFLFYKLWRRCETPKLQHEPRHKPHYEPRHGPRYEPPPNITFNFPQNHVEVQPQQQVPDYGWKA
ncbi:hypothetical protein DER46DRAFT_658653 [Fusarium sp. MPI-SDFR-AT-0072]|uniref:Mid2 domain-containing protein n=1 Tax=Fusarium oxysporum f. sp. rapae TaxID=485398 RepID=A0A8J5NVQ6_FUSOX|nr:hypothetical protein Forpe1208_v008765 [Fusarium oxysporum f. sp. rapae]KAH7169026.1 hypothetical protein DER46DRAFT_658653 [Fusarium sp. MPI-SDFR-AT-0072]